MLIFVMKELNVIFIKQRLYEQEYYRNRCGYSLAVDE